MEHKPHSTQAPAKKKTTTQKPLRFLSTYAHSSHKKGKLFPHAGKLYPYADVLTAESPSEVDVIQPPV